jgi:pilus assembly protein Flp/PilA
MLGFSPRVLLKLQQLFEKEEAQDLVEYALVVALVAFSATAGMKALGSGISHAFSAISSTLSSSLT